MREILRQIRNFAEFMTVGFLVDHYHAHLDFKFSVLNPQARHEAWKLAYEAKLAEIRGEKTLSGLLTPSSAEIAALENVEQLVDLHQQRARRLQWMRNQ